MPETDTTFDTLKAALADRYDVARKLGAGGMAAVYLARDIKHDREVAIKVLHPELAATIGADRFEREIKMAAKLQHPNILGMYDSGAADGLLFYVMPFVQGESLRDKLDRETQLGVEEAIQLTLEVAGALGHAHSKGIIHRDIKPENILLQDGHALVADFGIAKAAEEGSNAKLTQTGMALGTPVYMAPEQSVGEKVGPTADLYSLGCMLYEMLAGEPPFTGKNGAMIMAKHALEAVPSIRIIRPNVPEEVEQAIFAAMGKVPADRPKTAAEFMEIMGVPMGATATRRAVMRVTATNRVPTGATPVLQLPAQAAPVPFYKKPVVVAAATVVLLGAALGGYQLFAGARAEPEAVGGLARNSLAVLYFDDNSPDSSLRYLADGLTEGLIEKLTGVQGISVASRSGSEQVRRDGLSSDSAAQILKAGTLIDGDVSPDKDGIRVNVRMVDGTSGADIPGGRQSFTLPIADLSLVRDSLAGVVALLVRDRIGSEIALATTRAETRNSAAWSLVQRAEQLRKRGEAAGDPEVLDREFRTADSLLADAERLDPRWIRPVIARAQLDYRRSYLARRDPATVKPWIEEGMKDIERALAMDGVNPDALELRGTLRYWGYLIGIEPDEEKAARDLAAAQADFEKATDINPLQAGAWASLSHLYNNTGGPVQIARAAFEALKADAFLSNADQIIDRLFLSYYDLNDPTNADRWCQESKQRFPGSFLWPRCELYMLTTRNRPADISLAWRMADTMVALTPAGPRKETNRLRAHMLVAAVVARAADSASKSGQAGLAKTLADSARAVAERSIGNAEIDRPRELAYGAAFVYTLLGDKDRAIDNLGLYLGANEGKKASFAQDPGWWFLSLQGDPKFVRLVGRQ